MWQGTMSRRARLGKLVVPDFFTHSRLYDTLTGSL